ncbi:MAG: amidohydrolase family protein [Polyangiaceae bacterium]|nr:amidohydrolase family protein [Polyangiaceae bacterium]MCW5789397.1 amidohydrolase family protein [Polyangiaceae bacterium]
MAFDLKIVGGTVVDGTGAGRRRANIGIEAGRIVEIGECSGSAKETLDAEGAIVTPGFVDIHTHYDGQVSWDADLAPSSLHGVTTCIMGSCGVGFAPVRKQDRERLIELMEGVEDIPGTALAEGINWRWETFQEYMQAVDFPHAMDYGLMATHDALRVYVMGERALASEVATEDDVAKMAALVREAVEAGAFGFSTGRTDNHRSKDGSPTPAAEATARELTGIARAIQPLGHGVLQAVSDFDMDISLERFDGEFDVIEEMAKAARGHHVSVSLLQRDNDPTQWRRILERCERSASAGVPIHVQVAARAIGVMLGLEATFHPFMGFPSYKAISHLPLAERVKAMRDPAFKARLLSEQSEPVAGDGSPIPPLADKLLANLDFVSLRLFRLGEYPDYEPKLEDSLYYEGKARGVSALSAVYDALLESDGKELLYFPLYNYIDFDLNNVKTMLHNPLALPGLSDGGAHVGTICDASFPTFMLSHWARDRQDSGLSLERVVQMLAHDTARYVGLTDRGTLEVGKRADLNVIDFEGLRLRRPRLVEDLPAGGKRLLQDAEGYRATLVHGTAITKNGQLTGELPGRLLRAGC